MKRFFNSIIHLDKSVIYLFGVSLLAIIFMKLIPFISIDDSYWDKINSLQEISINICYSIIAGCIFYYFTVHLPLHRLREQMAFYLHNNLMSICSSLKTIYFFLDKNDEQNFEMKNAIDKFEEINNKIFKVLVHKDLLENDVVYQISTISDYIEKIIKDIQDNEFKFDRQINGNLLNLVYSQSKKLADLTDKFRQDYGDIHVQKFNKENTI